MEFLSYARQSKLDPGRVPSTEWQQKEVRDWAKAEGHTIAAEYADVDLSGYRDVYRPEFERMLADLDAGKGVGIVAWSLDRLTRKGVWGRDTIELLRRMQDSGVTLRTIDDDYDTTTARGKRRLADDLSRAEEESERISKRSRAGKLQAAESGRMKDGGPRPFGLERADGKLTGRTVAKEVALIHEAVDRVLGGESLRSVVLDWQRRDVRTSRGKPWSTQGLRLLLLQRRLTGQREHHGVVVAEDAYPAILDVQTAERLRVVLNDPSRRAPTHGRSHLLTGLIRCGRCGCRMRASQPLGKRKYTCPPAPEGCNGTSILAEPTEAEVVRHLFGALASDAYRESVHRVDGGEAADADQWVKVLQDGNARLAELAEEWSTGELDRVSWRAARVKVEADMDEARRALASQHRATFRARFTEVSLEDQWGNLRLLERREVLAELVDQVVIHPATTGGRFDVNRIEPRWRF